MISRYTAEIEFPTAGTVPLLNRVRVTAYPEYHRGFKSCPHASKSSEVKKILGYGRYKEDIDTIDMDVVVHFDDPDFDGQSYGLALVLADKRARYGAQNKYKRIVATGIVGKQGTISRVEAFEEKLERIVQVLDQESLLVLPKENLENDSMVLEQLKSKGGTLRAISRLDEIQPLWQAGMLEALSSAEDRQPHVSGWWPFLGGMMIGFLIVMLVVTTIIIYHRISFAFDVRPPPATGRHGNIESILASKLADKRKAVGAERRQNSLDGKLSL